MQPHASRRTAFAACILAIAGIAVLPVNAAADDAGLSDAGLDAAPLADASSTPEAGLDSAVPTDATPDAPAVVMDGSPMGASSFVMDDGAAPVYTGSEIFQRLCVDNPNAPTFAFKDVTAPYADKDATACKAFNSGHTAAHACLCDHCFTLQRQCDALPGCREIQKCGFDTGCTDANSCYLFGGKCVAPIDKWGTGSVSTALSQLLESCGASNSCPTQ